MGKWTVQHTEDVLLAKIRTAIQDAIETHRNEKRQDGEARPVTLNEFVEELDAKDAFTAKLMEILVKEYSERRSRATPVERQFQIATTTSNALSHMLTGASVYDNCRPAHWTRRRRVPMSLRAHMIDERSAFGVQDLRDEPTIPNPSSLRDDLFQNALEELEDGEFGAHWNSSLNEVYANSETHSRWRRTRDALQPIPILHDVNLAPEAQQDGPGIMDSVSVSSSSISSDIEAHVAQNADTIPRHQERSASSNNTLINRQGLSRAPLLRRNSLRRSRYGRATAVELDATRRRLARNFAEEHDALWTPPDEGSIEWIRYFGEPATTRTPNILRGDEPAGAAFRRHWSTLEPDPIASGSNEAATRSGSRSLRRGGLRAPEGLTSRRHPPLASPSITTTPSSPAPDGTTTRQLNASDELGPVWDRLRPPSSGSMTLPGRWGPEYLPLYPNWRLPDSSASVLPPLATTSSGVIPTPPAEPDAAAEE